MAKVPTAKNPVTRLTAKQEEFCFQTVALGNPNRAYRMAYDASGMQPNSVRAEVAKLLTNPMIADRIHDLQQVAEAKLGVTIERIARELACLGFSRMSDFFYDDGMPIPVHLLPDDLARAVKSVTIVERKGGLLINLNTGEQEQRNGRKRKQLEADGIEWVPMREKKIELHDKHAPLQTLARWKKMIKDRPDDEDADPNDVTKLTDAEVEEQLKANQAALEMIERARKRRAPVKKKAEARATKAG